MAALFDPKRDARLMARVRDGDAEAFEDLYNRYGGAVGKFLYHLSWDRQRAEDGIQEVFLRLWKGARNWQDSGRFSTYLFQIAKNWWLSQLDRDRRRPRPLPLNAPASDDALRRHGDPAHPGRGPEKTAVDREMGQAIREAVSALPEKLHLTFVLNEYEGLKYREVADVLDIPVGTVKSRMAAAEKFLRARLKAFTPRLAKPDPQEHA